MKFIRLIRKLDGEEITINARSITQVERYYNADDTAAGSVIWLRNFHSIQVVNSYESVSDKLCERKGKG